VAEEQGVGEEELQKGAGEGDDGAGEWHFFFSVYLIRVSFVFSRKVAVWHSGLECGGLVGFIYEAMN